MGERADVHLGVRLAEDEGYERQQERGAEPQEPDEGAGQTPFRPWRAVTPGEGRSVWGVEEDLGWGEVLVDAWLALEDEDEEGNYYRAGHGCKGEEDPRQVAVCGGRWEEVVHWD